MEVTAVCRKVGRWWAIDVPEVTGVHSQAVSLDEVVEQAADAVSTMLEIDPAAVRVRVVTEPVGASA